MDPSAPVRRRNWNGAGACRGRDVGVPTHPIPAHIFEDPSGAALHHLDVDPSRGLVAGVRWTGNAVCRPCARLGIAISNPSVTPCAVAQGDACGLVASLADRIDEQTGRKRLLQIGDRPSGSSPSTANAGRASNGSQWARARSSGRGCRAGRSRRTPCGCRPLRSDRRHYGNPAGVATTRGTHAQTAPTVRRNPGLGLLLRTLKRPTFRRYDQHVHDRHAPSDC